MKIGGYDWSYDTNKDISVFVNILKDFWGDAVVEVDTDLPDRKEVFVYKDQSAYDNWEECGETGQNDMVYLITDPGLLTVVVEDNDNEEMKQLRQLIEGEINGT